MTDQTEEKTMPSGQVVGAWVVRELDRQFRITADEALRLSPQSQGLEDLFRDLRAIPAEEFQQRLERIRKPEAAQQEAEDARSGEDTGPEPAGAAGAEPGFTGAEPAAGTDPAAEPAAGGGGAARDGGAGEQGAAEPPQEDAGSGDADADTGGAGRSGGGGAKRGRMASADVRHDSGGGKPDNRS